jgi:hypothetical protein
MAVESRATVRSALRTSSVLFSPLGAIRMSDASPTSDASR